MGMVRSAAIKVYLVAVGGSDARDATRPRDLGVEPSQRRGDYLKVWSEVGLEVWLEIGLVVGLEVWSEVWLEVWLEGGLEGELELELEVGLGVGLEVGLEVGLQVGSGRASKPPGVAVITGS